ncbi:protein N-terminal asparagine amidohydrolase-like isoform X1 [Palaemon carinicauda]|uniref:protein N-terminal asparagine amidohydrolase-like isoform X1 n=1 Tax=Palaemon carinicauda TaxID=392227 RepID=UPI0035B62D7D
MVILIDGSPLDEVPNSTKEFYQAHQTVVSKASSFASQNNVLVQKEYCLYVAQGEFAVVPGNDPKIEYIGSDDATTCHIVIIKHTSGTVCVAHFDGSKNEEAAVDTMVSKVFQIDGRVDHLELYVVGGYVPEEGSKEAKKNESESLSLKILGLFMRHKCHFNLALWCTCYLNTMQGINGPKPIMYGVAIHLSTGEVFPATFRSHDPALPIRSASRWMGDHTVACDLYDHTNGTITIKPFNYSDVDHFAFYLKLSDQVLLNNFSTSPKVEPPSFCHDLREVFRVFVTHRNPDITLFPNCKPKCYSMNDCGLWQLLKD